MIGRTFVTSIGPFSALIQFFTDKEKIIFNLLCKQVYYKVLPSIYNKTPIYKQKQLGDWLEWGKGDDGSAIKVQRCLKKKIGEDFGTYYGEW